VAVLQLPVHSYKLRSSPASSARLVNCYVEQLPPDAKTPFLLTRVPGVFGANTIGTGPIRGMGRAFGNGYLVSGNTFVKFGDVGGGFTNLGTVTSGAVSIANNVDKVVVVTAPNAYYSDGTTALALAQITDPDFLALGARWVVFIKNFMVFVSADGRRFFWADVGTVTDYDALNFATPESAPDDIVGVAADHDQLVLFGSETVELWQVTSTGFSQAINGKLELGCFNGDTIAKIDNSLMWLASDYTIRRLDGTTPVRVSTHAVEQFLSGVDVTSGRARVETKDGHIVYVLCFSTGCWCYDVTTGEWHERVSHPEAYYRWQFGCEAYGRQWVGDFESNKIGYLDSEFYAEYIDGVQRMEFTTQPVHSADEVSPAIHDRLELVLETGVGITTGQGSDPEVMLAYSDDGGITFENLPNRKIGAIGERFTKVVWNALGGSFERVYRWAVSDPVRITVTRINFRGRNASL
jgi:hypothetical protein